MDKRPAKRREIWWNEDVDDSVFGKRKLLKERKRGNSNNEKFLEAKSKGSCQSDQM